jgi:hypothetical protein
LGGKGSGKGRWRRGKGGLGCVANDLKEDTAMVRDGIAEERQVPSNGLGHDRWVLLPAAS